MSTIEALNTFKQLGAVRLVASSNQSGTYFNGSTNNGVGATFTYATGTLTIDSVTVNLNDYILFAGQTSAYQNGIYQCITVGATGVAAVLQRRGDFQCIEQISGASYCPVAAGTVYAGSMWTVVEPLPAAIGVPVTSGANNINFQTITSPGSSLYLQATNNLSDVSSVTTAVTNLGFPAAANRTLSTSFSTPDTASDLFWVDVTAGQAALASTGKVQIAAAASTKSYIPRDIRVNYSSAGLSGSSGNRLLVLTDGTTVWNNAGITAALLGTPINTLWGGTGNPVAGTVAQNTASVAGTEVYLQYSGGTTDYSAGSVSISVLMQRVA